MTAITPKLDIYFMNDSHIMSIRRLLGWRLNDPVPFAGALVFELYKNIIVTLYLALWTFIIAILWIRLGLISYKIIEVSLY